MQFWSNMIIEKNAESVLELACGTGRLANVFLRENAHYTGIDIIPAKLNPADHNVPSGVSSSSSEIVGNQGSWWPLLTPMM